MATWYFTRVRAQDGSEPYGPEYEEHVTRSVRRAGGHAHIVRDASMPHQLRHSGWWSLLWMYSPYAEQASGGAPIYFAGLDTVFVDVVRLQDALDAVPEDIAGIQAYSDGGFVDCICRVRPGSEGARKVWAAARRRKFQFAPSMMENRWVRDVAAGHIGTTPEDHLVPSYKVITGVQVQSSVRRRSRLDQAAALVFHGSPRPMEVWRNPAAPLHDFVRKYW